MDNSVAWRLNKPVTLSNLDLRFILMSESLLTELKGAALSHTWIKCLNTFLHRTTGQITISYAYNIFFCSQSCFTLTVSQQLF